MDRNLEGFRTTVTRYDKDTNVLYEVETLDLYGIECQMQYDTHILLPNTLRKRKIGTEKFINSLSTVSYTLKSTLSNICIRKIAQILTPIHHYYEHGQPERIDYATTKMIPSLRESDNKSCLTCQDYEKYVVTTDDPVIRSLRIPTTLQKEIKKALFMKTFNSINRHYGFPRCPRGNCVLKQTEYHQYYLSSITRKCLIQHNNYKPVIELIGIQEMEQINSNEYEDSD